MWIELGNVSFVPEWKLNVEAYVSDGTQLLVSAHLAALRARLLKNLSKLGRVAKAFDFSRQDQTKWVPRPGAFRKGGSGAADNQKLVSLPRASIPFEVQFEQV